MIDRDTDSTGRSSELLVELNRDLSIALHRQLESRIRDRIRHGHLTPGTVLPSARGLAHDLGLSRGVVVEAYEQLVAEGYLVSRSGGYTQVAAAGTTKPHSSAHQAETGRTMTIDFRYGRPDVSQFPRAAWMRSTRRVLNEISSERLNYLDGGGAPELRDVLASYLNRVRGTAANPENIVITNGFAQGVRLVAQVLATHGFRTLATEDPSSNDDIRSTAPRLGINVVGIPSTGEASTSRRSPGPEPTP
jgi:GntR family transcriptional regulator / MocR family aminotransferase